jgi:hypothetical protein
MTVAVTTVVVRAVVDSAVVVQVPAAQVAKAARTVVVALRAASPFPFFRISIQDKSCYSRKGPSIARCKRVACMA